jgi:DNA-binding MarR family transcriptional regulator
MEASNQNFLDTCLFFNTNAFSRQLLKLAEVEFKPLKLSPAHASLLLLIFDNPGINPKELSSLLQLTPSTITRFIDSLAKKKLVRRKAKGKSVFIFPTQKSMEMQASIALAYKNL